MVLVYHHKLYTFRAGNYHQPQNYEEFVWFQHCGRNPIDHHSYINITFWPQNKMAAFL